jgi:hypothetical protein
MGNFVLFEKCGKRKESFLRFLDYGTKFEIRINKLEKQTNSKKR